MTWLYGGALVLGVMALIGWALLQSPDDGDPTSKRANRAPQFIAGVVAFGMGGMSATYAGWNPWAAAAGALVAAALGGLLARTRRVTESRIDD